MALDKFLAKKMLVLYYSLLRDEFVGLYVRTVVGYNGPCTWDSVVHTGMKKKKSVFCSTVQATPKIYDDYCI